METKSKHKSIQYIQDIRGLNSDIDIIEAVSIEERLGEEVRRGKLMWVIVIASLVITLAILVLIYLRNFGLSKLDDETILVLASGTVVAIVGYMGAIVKYYWNK